MISSPNATGLETEAASPKLRKFMDSSMAPSSKHSRSTIKRSKLTQVDEEMRNPAIYGDKGSFDIHEMLKDESEDEED